MAGHPMQQPRKPRLYEPVWKHLKLNKKAVLAVAHKDVVPHIKRMISKEKDSDDGFKLINELESHKLQFSWDQDKLELTVTLTQKYGLVPTEV
jgi:hypothetical protein